MKRKLFFILGILGITISSFAFTATNSNTDCPLRGTQECSEYPACCE